MKVNIMLAFLMVLPLCISGSYGDEGPNIGEINNSNNDVPVLMNDHNFPSKKLDLTEIKIEEPMFYFQKTFYFGNRTFSPVWLTTTVVYLHPHLDRGNVLVVNGLM